jgi:hypothetical protein
MHTPVFSTYEILSECPLITFESNNQNLITPRIIFTHRSVFLSIFVIYLTTLYQLRRYAASNEM